MLRVGSIPSGSKVYSDEALDRTYHFKWKSIRNLLYLTSTYAGHPIFFHVFNDMMSGPGILACLFVFIMTVFHYIVTSLVIGMTYMCADLFIKQYTSRLDCNQNLCPVLKDVTFSLILQSTLFCSLSLRYTGDGARYLASSFASTPIWSVCSHLDNSSRCMTSRHILQHCEKPEPRELIQINITSVHIYYKEYMNSNVRGAWTWRFFVSAVIWIFNFCLTTIPDSVVLKIYKHIAYLKQICTILSFTYLAISSGSTKEAFFRLMKINDNGSISDSIGMVALVYGIGMIGVYDYGSTSPYTMVDNAVIIFTTLFIILCAIRSMTVYILLLGLSNCIDVDSQDTANYHYMLFVLMPLATEFLYGQKLINITIYLYVILSLLPCLMLYTVTMTRLFHSEFPSMKSIYIQGLICLFEFCLSIPMLLVDQYFDNIRFGLIEGLTTTVLYLGGLRMAIIMWIYGVTRFSTDINFWLGFSPTKFWTVCWSALPALLLMTCCYKIFEMSQVKDNVVKTCAFIWFLTTVVIEFALQTRTIVRYVMQNNLMGAFRSNKKYGPFDKRDRNRRRKYDVIIDNRQCYHDCMSIDEEIECNHMPLMNTGEGHEDIGSDISDSTLTKMYENVPSREESVINIVDVKPNAKEKQN